MLLLLLLVVVTKTVFCALADSSVNVRAGTAPHDCAMYAKICNSQCESARLTHHTILWYRRFSGIWGGWPRESLWCKWNAIDDVMTWKWIHLSNMWVLECTRLAIIEFASLVRLAKCKKKKRSAKRQIAKFIYIFFRYCSFINSILFHWITGFSWMKNSLLGASEREKSSLSLAHTRRGMLKKSFYFKLFFVVSVLPSPRPLRLLWCRWATWKRFFTLLPISTFSLLHTRPIQSFHRLQMFSFHSSVCIARRPIMQPHS